jgi:hypothetical protein
LINTCRTSVPLLLMGLAHQLIEPDADPVADGAAELMLLPPPLLQPVAASAPATPASAASRQPRSGALRGFLGDPARAMKSPTNSS